jgi:DNA polymerase-1
MWETDLPPAECFLPDSRGLQALVNEIYCTEEVALDTETTGLSLWKAVPLFWSLSWRSPSGAIRRVFMPASTMVHFSDCFADPDKRWIFANAKFDTHMLANIGINIAGHLIDTQVMHALLYEEERHGLKQMHQALFGWVWKDFEKSFGKINKKVDGAVGDLLLQHWETNRDNLIEYAANDAYGTFRIYEKLRDELIAAGTWSAFPEVYPTLWELFDKTEVPFTKVLWHCERNGQLIDVEFLKTLEVPIEQKIKELEKQMVALRGQMFNPQSGPQRKQWLVDERGLQPFKKTKGGKSGVRQDSIDKSFYEKYEDDEAVQLLSEHAKLSKMLGTYVTKLPANLDPFGRAHPRFNQTGARTGRLSSSGDYNAQNVPSPEKDKFKVRHSFIAGPGKKLIVGDYEQLEMRLLAISANEPDMIDVFNRGWDIHMGNAALVFAPSYKRKHNIDLTYEKIEYAKKVDKKIKNKELPPDAMTEELRLCLSARQAAKTIGFG